MTRGLFPWPPVCISDTGRNALFSREWPGHVTVADGAQVDSFGRLRVSNPTFLFDAQMTYGLQPLLYEQIISGDTGYSVNYDATNRMAEFEFASTTNGVSRIQSYAWPPYQPGRSHLALITFKIGPVVTGVRKFVGLGDTGTGILLEQDGSTVQLKLNTSTSLGSTTVAQSSWSLDPMNGTGPSGITLDLTRVQILVIDYQALYVGRVRVGFDIGGNVHYVHEFDHANVASVPYVPIASLPVAAGMYGDASPRTAKMNLVCASVMSEGGQPDAYGFPFSADSLAVTADTGGIHALSIQPKTTFGGIENRSTFILDSINVLNSGSQPIRVDLLIGQALAGDTGALDFEDANTTYSAFEYNNEAALSGPPAIVADSFYVTSTNQTKGTVSRTFSQRYPITLNAAGAVRVNGRLSVRVTTFSATSACRVSAGWIEVR